MNMIRNGAESVKMDSVFFDGGLLGKGQLSSPEAMISQIPTLEENLDGNIQ